MTLVLASNSPRRKELIQAAGWDFTVDPAEIDEDILPGEEASIYVRRLAESKALAVAGRRSPGEIVLAADTTVAVDGEILAKPAGPDDAASMLARLRGRRHEVHTGVAVVRVADGALFSTLVTTGVEMRRYTEEEVQAYIASGDPLDKAGAYAIQNQDFHPVEQIQGCYTNVVGLPLCAAAGLLTGAGARIEDPLPPACHSQGQQGCPLDPSYQATLNTTN